MADPVIDAQIAARFPTEWAKANDPRFPNNSKRRQQLRKRYRITLETEAFRAANPHAACGNCEHRHPWSGRLTCSLENDFEGYSIVQPAQFCTRWDPIPAAVVQPQHPSHDGQAQSASPNGDDARKSQQSKER